MASFDEAIPPGQVGRVRATFAHTQNLSGTVTKGVTVTTNDPARPTFVLSIRGTFVGSVLVLPAPSLQLAVGGLPDSTGRLLVRQDPTEKGTLALVDLSSTVPWIQLSSRRTEAGESLPGLPAAQAGDWLVEARVAGEVPGRQAAAEIRFKTGLPREPEVKIPVFARVFPEISLSPQQIRIPYPDDPGRPASAMAWVTIRQDLDPAGITAETSSKAFRATLSPTGPKVLRLDVSWSPDAEGAPMEGLLTLKLGSATATAPIRVLQSRPAGPSAPPGPAPGAPTP